MLKDLNSLMTDYPILKPISEYQPVYWQNSDFGQAAALPLNQADIFDASARWERFAPYLATAFPETAGTNGIIESPLLRIAKMQQAFERQQQTKIPGKMYLKADNLLPISGSIKSRGGIYEVLKFAEKIAMRDGDLVYLDNYAVLATAKYHQIFEKYGIAVGSTGNLGLSIGIAAATFGFQTTVHMSADARQWKKDLLRAKGVNVVEYDSDFTTAITAGRAKAAQEPNTYFIDDEGSKDLFLGYAVAGIRIQKQLKDLGITPDEQHPVFVYLPAGVGGSPSGVSFGMQTIMPVGIYPVFVEPTHVPSVTVGMVTGLNDKIAVSDLGLDGKTEADGLAVGRPSRIAGEIMRTLLYGSQTFNDDDIYRYLTMLIDTEDISLEPSSTSGFTGIIPTVNHFEHQAALANATHIVWATGGSMVPEADMAAYYARGQRA